MRWATLAFGFQNALLLGWLAAAAVPVIIHLWNRRRYSEVSWAAMEYLLAAVRKNSRRIRVENWLLLAVRLAIIVLAVLAAAEPYVHTKGASFTPGERTLKVLVLDGSYSMSYKPAEKTRFDWAKELGRQILADSKQGDGFALVMMADPSSIIVRGPALDAKSVGAELMRLRFSHGRADLPSALDKVAELMSSSTAHRFEHREVYFLTDLGRNTWLLRDWPATVRSRFQDQLSSLAAKASLVVLDLGQSNATNRAISDLRLAEPFAVVGKSLRAEAQLQNFVPDASTEIVELLVDGRAVKEQRVHLPARGRAAASFEFRLESAGEHALEVRCQADRLALDDHRFLAVAARQYISVLCVNGKPAGEGRSSATDYLALALNPTQDASGGTVRPEVVSEEALMDRDLGAYDAIFMCNVAQFTADEARVLDGYLTRGGGVVFSLGDQVLPQRYNQQLAGPDVKILPAHIGPLVREGQHRFDPLSYRHPLVHAFAGREQAGLLTTPVYRYFRLVVPPASGSKVALAFSGGDAAIVEAKVHAGRSILLATDVSLSSFEPDSKRPWTLLPVWPSYVPLVQELLALAVSGRNEHRNVRVGQPLGGTAKAAGQSVLIQPPFGQQMKIEPATQDRSWRFDAVGESGFYRVDSQTQSGQLYAANLDTAESDLTNLRVEDLPKQFSTAPPSRDEVRDFSKANRSPMAVQLLYAALALLLAESFLAWRFGNRAA